MTSATVTTKGQVTIPVDIRNSFDIQAGDTIVFYKSLGGDLKLHVDRPARGSGAGVLSAGGERVSVAEMDQGIAEAVRTRRAAAGGRG